MNKIIHQMWFQGITNMPEKYITNINGWKHNNPDWKYIFWDEESIIKLLKNKHPDFLERFNSLDKDIKKCDAARYFILYEYGGIYADLDTTCHHSVDSLINNFKLNNYDIIFAEESQDAHDEYHWKSKLRQLVSEQYGEIRFVGNAIIISKASTEFWLEFLEASFNIADFTVLESFSTWHLSKFLQETSTKSSYKILEWENMLSTNYEPNKSYFTHNYDATWFNHSAERPWEG